MALTCPSCNNLNPLEARFCARCGTEIAGDIGPVDFTGRTLRDGRYEVENQLGAGAVGSVYQAMDTQLKRGVALKVLHADMVSHATARTRMIREAQAIAGIDHPNVVRIYELFEEGEHLVLVLELVKGGTLADKLAKGALGPEEAKGMMLQLLEGLEAIHAAEIVHRDIKPANVLITEKGVAKLTDFGVAHDQKGRGMTRAGARLGTPEYMAPEQVKGQEVDARTDLYACGVVLYQLLTGAVPFEGESDFEIFEGHVRGEVDLTALPATTPKPLRDTTSRALNKDSEKRFQSAEQMREGLNGLVGPVVDPDEEFVSMEDPHTGHACPMCGTSVKKRQNDDRVLHCLKCGYSGEGSLWRVQKTGMDAIANLRFECGECAQQLEQKSNVIIARCGACGAKVLPRQIAGMKKKDKGRTITLPAPVKNYVEGAMIDGGGGVLAENPHSVLRFWAILRRRELTPEMVVRYYRAHGKKAEADFVAGINLREAWEACDGPENLTQWGRTDLDDELKTILSEMVSLESKRNRRFGSSLILVVVFAVLLGLVLLELVLTGLYSTFVHPVWIWGVVVIGALCLMGMVAGRVEARYGPERWRLQKKLTVKLALRGMSGPELMEAAHDHPEIAVHIEQIKHAAQLEHFIL